MFELKRLILLIRKQAVENHRLYGLVAALFTGLLACFYALTFPALHRPNDFQAVLFIGSLFLGGSVFANLVVKDLHESARSVWLLMLPASALEKVLNLFFYSVVLFVPAHLLLFYAVDVPAVALYNARHPENPAARLLDLRAANEGLLYQYLGFLVVQAGVLVGSVGFRQYALVKSMLAVFACYLVVYYLNGAVAALLMDEEIANAFPFAGFSVKPAGSDETPLYVSLPETAWPAVWAAGLALVLVLWIVAYFKLKERQV